MDTLTALRTNNPSLPFHSVTDAAFRRYGRVVALDAAALIGACEEAVTMPESGSRYVTSLPSLESMPAFEAVQRILRGEGDCQMGCCWGYNTRLNCLEYHRASEHLIAVSDLALLLAPLQAMEGYTLPAGLVEGFYVPRGTTVELYATTLHFAPCQTSASGFCSLVILPRGTNLPLVGERPAEGEGRLLWARDKWLIAHPDNTPVVARGAYPGLLGENFDIKYEGEMTWNARHS